MEGRSRQPRTLPRTSSRSWWSPARNSNTRSLSTFSLNRTASSRHTHFSSELESSSCHKLTIFRSVAHLKKMTSSSLFTNSSWFAFGDGQAPNEYSIGSLRSASLNAEGTDMGDGAGDDNLVSEDDELVDSATSHESEDKEAKDEDAQTNKSRDSEANETDEPPEWVEWRETSDSVDSSEIVPNGKLKEESPETFKTSPSETVPTADSFLMDDNIAEKCIGESKDEVPSLDPSAPLQSDGGTESFGTTTAESITLVESTHEANENDKKEQLM